MSRRRGFLRARSHGRCGGALALPGRRIFIRHRFGRGPLVAGAEGDDGAVCEAGAFAEGRRRLRNTLVRGSIWGFEIGVERGILTCRDQKG